MADAVDRAGQAHCPGCGHLNALESDFCAVCGAPLTWHATTDPFQTIFTEGYAARRALALPTKPIIAIGVWLWMLPIAVVSLAGLFFVLANLLYGLVTFQFGYLIAGMFG